MKIHLVRGAFANQFELQNFDPLAKEFDLKVIASKKPLTKINLPTINLPSPYDLPSFPYKRQILNRIMTDQHWLFGLEDVIKDADIVHTAETYYAYTHQAVELRKRNKIKMLISTCWETIPYNNEKFWSLRNWKKRAFKYIDYFITPTGLAKEALIAEGCDSKKIIVIPLGVDLDRFKPHKPAKEARNLLFVGRVVPEKGILDLLNAVSVLGKRVHLTIIGGGELPYHKPPNITIKQVNYDQIHKYYANADIFILPSHATKTWEEQYGMVLLEALASGLPIVSTPTGAIPEILDSAAIYARERDAFDLAHQISQFLDSYQLRVKYSRLARRRAENHFDRLETAKVLKELYNRLA